MITDFPEKLDKDTYYKLFAKLGAMPTFSTSNGKSVMMLRGLCHHSHSGHYSVIFDYTDTHKITCMSECGDTVYWWNYIKRVLNLSSSLATKEWIIDWLNGEHVEIESDNCIIEKTFDDKPFDPHPAPIVPGIEPFVVDDLYQHFENNLDILKETVWCTKDHIQPDIMALYDIAVYPEHDTIILPHHNINGEIVGLYERNFNILRSEAKLLYPEMPYEMLIEYPRAKYTPLLKEGIYADENEGKMSWSFPNSKNLYGLHLAKEAINKTGIAIIFEGAKSVMLAHQYGYTNAVATHTFGANENHIAMLIEQGAKTIYFAFDKQYRTSDRDDKEWKLYEKKTRDLARRIKNYVNVYRICDKGELLGYKDAPIDKGKEIFAFLYEKAEPLMINGEEKEVSKTFSERDYCLKKIEIKLNRKKSTEQIRQENERYFYSYKLQFPNGNPYREELDE